MKILVVGGAGYIGSHNVRALVERGDEVVVMDSLVTGHREAVHPGAKFYKGDIRSAEDLDSVFTENRIDAVLHFAAFIEVGESVAKPLKYFNNNVGGMQSLLEAMVRHGVDKLIFSSTAAVYGEPESVPIPEDAPKNPTNPYGESKLIMEKMMKWTEKAHGIRSVILRYFNVGGAYPGGLIGEDPKGIPNNLVPYIAQVAVGKLKCLGVFGDDYNTPDGTGVRDYIHVVDLAKGHVKALKKLAPGSGVNIYNLGTGKGYSVLDVLHAFEKACGKTLPYEIKPRRAGDIATCYCDASKAERELGWKAEFGIDRMCVDSWRWQSNNPNGYAG